MPVLEILVERKMSCLREENPEATAEMAMAELVVEFFRDDIRKIIKTTILILEQANLVREAEELKAMQANTETNTNGQCFTSFPVSNGEQPEITGTKRQA
jgi:hypothetical protein